MDQNLQSNQDKNISAPPPLEIEIRTMESDVKAFQEKGGEVSDIGMKSEYSAVPGTEQQSVAISGYQGSEKSIFSPADVLQQNQIAPTGTSSGLKLTLVIVGILIAAIGLGLLGYYVIFPLIFK